MKKFLIIGNGNAVTYKEVFPLIKDNQIWLGASKGMGGSMVFLLDEELYDESKQTATRKEEGKYCISVMLATWLTNIEHNKKNPPLELTRHYNAEEYPKYDNYDAIEVGRVSEIPMDYEGIMGVPITFLDKYCPTQFEIIGEANHGKDSEWDLFTPSVDGKTIFKRILIKKVKEEDIKEPKEADIVVTNPPFSLFREYVALLMQYNKKFLIIGNINAITYKEIFPLIKENQLWMGATYFNGGAAYFYGDASLYDESKVVDPKHYYVKDGFLFWRVNGVRWFTNLDHYKRHEEIDLYKHYNAEEYPKYDNYDAIEVGRVTEIPMDYDGVMGVPISFLDKYCPSQFEIKGIANSARWIGDFPCYTIIDGQKIYNRLLIKRISK